MMVGCAEVLDLGSYEPNVPVPLLALGQSCSAGDACASTFCVDGVCCASSCEGSCEQCDDSGSCALVPPTTACEGTRRCDAAGHCTDGTPELLRGYGAAASEVIDLVALDADDNHLVAGYCMGASAALGGQSFDCDAARDVVVAKIDAAGLTDWSLVISGTVPETPQHASSLVVGRDGGIYLTLFSTSGLVIAGTVYPPAPQTVPNWDAFVVKLLPDGSVDGVVSLATPGNELIYASAPKPGGGVIVTGAFDATYDLDGEPVTTMGSYDVFLAAYAPDMTLAAQHVFGGAGAEWSAHLAIGDDAMYLTGQYDGSLDIGGQHFDDAAPGDALYQFYLARFDLDFELDWVASVGDSAMVQLIDAMAVTADGGVLVSGRSNAPLTLGGATLMPVGVVDVFAAKLTRQGDVAFAQRYLATPVDGTVPERSNIAADADGNIVLAGHFIQKLELDGDTLLLESGMPAGDAYVMKLDPSGERLWLRHLSSVGFAAASALAVDSAQRIVTFGRFNGQLHVDGIADLTLPQADDSFFARFLP